MKIVCLENRQGTGMSLSKEILELFGDVTKLNIHERKIPLGLILPLMRFKDDAEKKSIINNSSS